MQKDRRKEPRCLIDTPLFCTIQNQNGDKVISIINDISLNGAMILVPPDDQTLLPVGMQITFIEVPEQFATTLDKMAATVAWCKEKICGLHFEKPLPLSEEGLIAIVASVENNMGAGLTLYDDENFLVDFGDEDKF